MTVQEKHIYGMPNDQEVKLAATGSRILAACSGQGETATLRLIDNNTDLTVPVKAIHMLADILNQMALGNAISIIPIHTELTTQQTADMLNVSRPFLIKKILDTGQLKFHKAGNRRKIFFKDLMAYKEQQKKESADILAELAQLSQEQDMMG
jgi:excisionase family DNA binding protein